MMKIIIVVTLAALVTGTPQDEDDMRIVMGQKTARNIPYLVSIRKTLNGQTYQSCGGAILNPTIVLSAAHCFQNSLPGSAYKIGVGATNLQKQTLYPVKAYEYHEWYSSGVNYTYDVAIIKLAQRIQLIPGLVEPISLPTFCPKLPYHEYALAAGWGKIAEDSTAVIEDCNQIELKILKREDPGCAIYDKKRLLTNTMFCAGAGAGTGDVCQGDSGGPLVYFNPDNNDQPEVIGVVSWAAGCNRKGLTGVYTNVCAVSDWINQRV